MTVANFPTDADLRDDIRDAFQQRLGPDGDRIGVDVCHGVVTLVGHVPSMHERCTAESIVQRLHGIRAIANDIEIRSADGAPDSAIAEIAADALAEKLASASDDVKVVVRDGWLTLTGSVASEQDRTSAERAVHLLPGVRGVSNAVFIAPRA